MFFVFTVDKINPRDVDQYELERRTAYRPGNVHRKSVRRNITNAGRTHSATVFNEGVQVLTAAIRQFINLFPLKNLHARLRFISMFIKEADYWEKGLSLVTEVLETTLSVQRQYFYAEVRM